MLHFKGFSEIRTAGMTSVPSTVQCRWSGPYCKLLQDTKHCEKTARLNCSKQGDSDKAGQSHFRHLSVNPIVTTRKRPITRQSKYVT